MDLNLDNPPAPLARLLVRGENEGCVSLSELDMLAHRLDVAEDDLTALHDFFGTRGIEVTDDCGRGDVPATVYRNGDLATATTDALGLFLDEIRRHPPLTPADEVRLSERIAGGDASAKDMLITANLALVVLIARRYPQSELPLLDLIQEGIFGLIRATEKFDGRRGFRFATYATYWIRVAIQRGLETKARTIRVPTQIAQRERTIERTRRTLEARLGRDPTVEEIVAETDLTFEQVEALANLARTVTSLDRPLSDDGESVLADVLSDDRAGPDEEVEVSLRDGALRRALCELPQDERRVVELRYGIDGCNEPVGIAETGRQLAITPAETRKLEAQALRRLAGLREIVALREAA